MTFKRLFSAGSDDHDISVKRTWRGLRQLVRFGHQPDLRKVFEKHVIAEEELQDALRIDRNKLADLDDERLKARTGILAVRDAAAEARKSRKSHDNPFGEAEQLEILAARYREAAVASRRHRFLINGVRLHDHIKAHHILQRIRGRLSDFAGTWERDQICMYLGMLYLEADGGKGEIGIGRKSGKGIHLILSKDVPRWSARNKITIWDSKGGISRRLKPYSDTNLMNLLDESHRKMFERSFCANPEVNERDECRRRAIEKKLGADNAGAKRRWDFRKGPADIRNSLMHFRALRRGRLTYLVNAVRSMMAYDRKLKNAVSKSIIDLMASEGLILEWEMADDRLKYPRVTPALETHLDFLRHPDVRHLSFPLPQASPRLASMMQALFDFRSGGHRPDGAPEGFRPRYPEWYVKRAGRDLPDELKT